MAFLLGGGVMTLMGVLFLLLAPPMFQAVLPGPEQQPIIDAGVTVLRLVAFAMPPLASTIIFTRAARRRRHAGAGVVHVVRLSGDRIPLAYLLTCERIDLGAWGTSPGPNLGLFGAWLAMLADLLVRGGFCCGALRERTLAGDSCLTVFQLAAAASKSAAKVK